MTRDNTTELERLRLAVAENQNDSLFVAMLRREFAESHYGDLEQLLATGVNADTVLRLVAMARDAQWQLTVLRLELRHAAKPASDPSSN